MLLWLNVNQKNVDVTNEYLAILLIIYVKKDVMMFYEQYEINDIIRMFIGFKVFINKALDSIVVLTNPYKDDYELEVFEIRESALEIYRKAERLILEIEKELAKNHNSYKYALFNDIYE